MGLAGHSLGGYTVLGVGGGWPSWRLSGLKAILAMAPYALPFWNSRSGEIEPRNVRPRSDGRSNELSQRL